MFTISPLINVQVKLIWGTHRSWYIMSESQMCNLTKTTIHIKSLLFLIYSLVYFGTCPIFFSGSNTAYQERYVYIHYFGYIPSHLNTVNIQIEPQKNVLMCFCYMILIRFHTGHIYGIHRLLNSNLMYNIFHNLCHLK